MTNRMAEPGEINGDYFDRYSFGHAAFGVMMALGRVPPWAAVFIAVTFESSEDWLKDNLTPLFPYATHDSPKGFVGDIASTLAGYAAIRLAFPPSSAP
jgi:hypothetical protein